jgi:hypothetical protein
MTLSLTLTGCINLPDVDAPVEPKPPETEDPKPLPDLSVRLLAPVGTTYTNGSIEVSIEVTNGTPEAVELFAGTELLAILTGPYTFRWDTATKPEGSYTLTAKARRGTQTFTSEARTVVVDRTPPQVVARTPAPGTQAVSVRQPILVTFSEPLAPVSVNGATVRLWMRVDAVTREMTKTLSLSTDGTVMTITPTPRPMAPGDLILEVGSVADRSGNSLVSAENWSWRLPVYLALGTALSAEASPSAAENALAVDAQGRPLVAWREPKDDGSGIHAYVRRWTGISWEALGGPVSANPGLTSVDGLDIQVDSAGNPVMAWSEQSAQGYDDIHVQRWTGDSWTRLGSALRINEGGSWPLALAVDDTGGIFVAWTAYNASLVTDAYVHRWTGSGWEAVGGPLSVSTGNTSVLDVKIQVNPSGQPVVAWSETDGMAANVYVKRWTGSAWAALGLLSALPGNTPASSPSLQLDQAGHPVVAWRESDGTTSNIYVWRWTGSSWEAVGGPLSASAGDTSAVRPSLELDPAGMPVVSWSESDGVAESIHLWKWNGAAWSALGPALSAHPDNTPASRHDLEVDSRGNLFICWSEYGPLPNSHNLYVRQLNN